MGKKHVSQNIWRRIKEFAMKQKIEKKNRETVGCLIQNFKSFRIFPKLSELTGFSWYQFNMGLNEKTDGVHKFQRVLYIYLEICIYYESSNGKVLHECFLKM